MNRARIGTVFKVIGVAAMVCVLVPHCALFVQRFSQRNDIPVPYDPEGAEPLYSWMRVLIGVGVGSVLLWIGGLLKPSDKADIR
jgi:hypothetical protein